MFTQDMDDMDQRCVCYVLYSLFLVSVDASREPDFLDLCYVSL